MSEKSIINDMYEDMSITMPVDVPLPESSKVPQKASQTKVPEPAFKVVNKNSLTDVEYAIFNIALEGIERLSDTYSGLDEKFVADCSNLRLALLDVLANKFGYKDAIAAKADGLTFKLKANHEVELLKRGE